MEEPVGLGPVVFHLIILYTIVCPGYLSDLAPPFPIPNKEVKRVSADDTHSKAELGKVGRSRGIFLKQFLLGKYYIIGNSEISVSVEILFFARLHQCGYI